MSYKYYVRKDYKDLGFITGVAKCQANVEQNKELFEECKLMNDEIMNDINNGKKFYNLENKKLVEVAAPITDEVPQIEFDFNKANVTRETSETESMLLKVVEELENQGIKFSKDVKEWKKKGGL